MKGSIEGRGVVTYTLPPAPGASPEAVIGRELRVVGKGIFVRGEMVSGEILYPQVRALVWVCS